MTASTFVKRGVNRLLSPANLRLDTLVAEQAETTRLKQLASAGHFDNAVFPLPACLKSMAPGPILQELAQYSTRFDGFCDAKSNSVGYSFDNVWYSSPDAEVLYTLVRTQRPTKVVEVGSGHSTKLFRQAISDGGLETQLVCIDPQPRLDVTHLADEVYRAPVESFGVQRLLDMLQTGGMLFIDSSHTIKTGNDVLFLFLTLLPQLPPGILIHIHDIFLPYDYPREWTIERRWNWNEQYLLQALLTCSTDFEVIWAGHYLQRTRGDFATYFPHLQGKTAQSFWIRNRAQSGGTTKPRYHAPHHRVLADTSSRRVPASSKPPASNRAMSGRGRKGVRVEGYES